MEEDNENFNFDMINHAPNIHHNKINKNIPTKLKHPNAILRAKSLFKGTKLNRKKIKFKKDRINREPKEPPSEEGKIYDCKHPMCDKTFNDKNSYRKHLAIHGEKQYICQAENCGKKFLDNSKLRRHMLVHSGTKAYKCELCNKRFSLDFNLRTHLRIHTGEKPYICSFEGCYKRFSQSSNLSAHEKTHFLPKGEEEEDEGGVKKKKYFKVIRAIPEPIKPKKPLVILDRDKYEKRLEEERKLKQEENQKIKEENEEKEEQKKIIAENELWEMLNRKVETQKQIQKLPEIKEIHEIRVNDDEDYNENKLSTFLTRDYALIEYLKLVKHYNAKSI
jgi:hypothetical protein